MTVISLELNEINFDFVERFIAAGKLPNFRRLLESTQLTRTVAEKEYPFLEPWIQWPTVYSGLAYSDHGVFRLGDVVEKTHPQIWEELEAEGLSVAAISPMNAANRCHAPAFFLPDPWTGTTTVADAKTARLWGLVGSLVNANASEKLGFASIGRQLGPLAAGYLRPSSTPRHVRILAKALGHKWAKAAFLDSLLYDVAMTLIGRHRPDYVSVFMNAGAHIQHHHMFDSTIYQGEHRNPAWYSSAAENDEDPLLFIYEVYDEIVGDLMRRPEHHVLITTALSQVPNPREHYQYRLVDFPGFLSRAGVHDAAIEPRMSRDFLLTFDSRAAAESAIAKLADVKVAGKPLFKVDDRGLTLFCQVGYFGRREALAGGSICGAVADFSNDLVLVSIENGIHQTTGFHIDFMVPNGAGDAQIALTEVHDRLKAAALAHAGSRLANAA
jgi:hypothetical protein